MESIEIHWKSRCQASTLVLNRVARVSTWLVARILDLSPERDEWCCMFFGKCFTTSPEFLPLQLRLSGLATVVTAGPRARLKFIKIKLKSTENQMESIMNICWHSDKDSDGKSIEIHWKSTGNAMKSTGTHWNLSKSMEIHWTSVEIPFKHSNQIYWKSLKINWQSIRIILTQIQWNP